MGKRWWSLGLVTRQARQSRYQIATLLQMRHFSSFRIIRVTLAFAVALWMAGAGCLLGCENAVTAASTNDHHTTESLAVSGAACAAHSSAKHWVKVKHSANGNSGSKSSNSKSIKAPGTKTRSSAAAKTLSFGSRPASMMDCPLAVNATAALSKAGSDNAKVGLALTSANKPLLSSLEQRPGLIPPLRLPNRGHTYLRCCVFLI